MFAAINCSLGVVSFPRLVNLLFKCLEGGSKSDFNRERERGWGKREGYMCEKT
jgi:hypothetical protein